MEHTKKGTLIQLRHGLHIKTHSAEYRAILIVIVDDYVVRKAQNGNLLNLLEFVKCFFCIKIYKKNILKPKGPRTRRKKKIELFKNSLNTPSINWREF